MKNLIIAIVKKLFSKESGLVIIGFRQLRILISWLLTLRYLRWLKTPKGMCIGILIVGILLSLFSRVFRPVPREKAPEELTRPLLVEAVEIETFRAKLVGYGTAEPIRQVEVSSELKGKIVETIPGLKSGRLVKKGDVLIQIDDADYQATMKETRAECQRLEGEKAVLKRVIADTKLEMAAIKRDFELQQKDHDRVQKLFDKQVYSRARLESSEQMVTTKNKAYIVVSGLLKKSVIQENTVQAALDKARAQEHLAQVNIQRCKIISPFDGRLKDVTFETGEYINAGQHLLTIVSDSSLEITVSLDASLAIRILGLRPQQEPGRQHWFAVPTKVPVKIEWTEGEERSVYEGKVVRIEEFNPDTRTISLTVEPLETQKHCKIPLVSGMFCKVIFTGQELKNVYRIPWTAVQYDRDVFVVDFQNRLRQRTIKIFGTEGDLLIVSSGLHFGDLLVVQKMPRGMIDGTKVKTIATKFSPELTARLYAQWFLNKIELFQ